MRAFFLILSLVSILLGDSKDIFEKINAKEASIKPILVKELTPPKLANAVNKGIVIDLKEINFYRGQIIEIQDPIYEKHKRQAKGKK